MEITKALAALQPLYGKDNVEIITTDGRRVRGTVRSMKTTQALTTPSVKMEIANGQIVKIPFPTIAEIKDHPFMVGSQFHPEFLSRPMKPHPLFVGFIKAAKANTNNGKQ